MGESEPPVKVVKLQDAVNGGSPGTEGHVYGGEDGSMSIWGGRRVSSGNTGYTTECRK